MQLSELKRTILGLVASGKLGEAFEAVQPQLNLNSEANNTITLLSGDHARVFASEMKGKVTREQARVDYNNISERLVNLINLLSDSDLGHGGGNAADPLSVAAQKLPVQRALTPKWTVNCDRKKPKRLFFDAFDEHARESSRFQFYFLLSDANQQPESFSERMVLELQEDEQDDAGHSIEYRRDAAGRLKVEPVPLSSVNVSGCQKAFIKYFAERFGLENTATAFRDYLDTGLPLLPHKYVVSSFRLTASTWDEELTPPYLEWLIGQFAHTGQNIPTFLFFFVVKVKNAHQRERLRRDDARVLEGVELLARQYPKKVTVIGDFPPVHTDEFEYWIEEVGGDVPDIVKQEVIDLIVRRLGAEEHSHYRAHSELNMEHIEDFQQRVFQHHQ